MSQTSADKQGLHEAAADRPRLVPPTPAPAGRRQHAARVESESEASFSSPSPVASRSGSFRHTRKRPSSPFPSIRGEHLEQMFFNAPDHDESRCRTCCQTLRKEKRKSQRPSTTRRKPEDEIDEGYGGEEVVPVPTATQRADQMPRAQDTGKDLPPQTVLARVVRELEDDFIHYKAYVTPLLCTDHHSIYCELADQYKIMDAASVIAKRNVLAEHLKEVIDTLEQKVSNKPLCTNTSGRSDRLALRPPRFQGQARHR